jgi:hypothetical protein
MKLSLVLPASLLACAGASPPPPVVAIAPPAIDPPPVTTTSATSTCADTEHAEPPPINVTLLAPTKAIDAKLAEAVKRLPPFEQNAFVTSPKSLRTIDGKLRLHGKNGFAQVEVTLPVLTSQCEATIQTAIQMQRPVELKGKGRLVADQVPGHGYVSAFDLDDVTSCVSR